MPNTPANPIPSEHPHDSILSLCMLTDWTFTRYHTPGKSEYAVVYGTVVQDGSGRFTAGSRIRTSPVTLWAAPLAHTHNSVYCLPGRCRLLLRPACNLAACHRQFGY